MKISPREIPASVHLIGIGGAGMAALAHCLAGMNRSVSGSDLTPSAETRQLETSGVTFFLGHAAANAAGAGLVVASDAIPTSNVELAEARIRAIPVMRRAECLNLVCRTKQPIFVGGSHGKSSTAAMLATVLEHAGAQPSFAIGAAVPALQNQRARIGKGAHFVAEACEAFQNLTAFHPHCAVITNIDDEHLDHYGTQEKLDEAFVGFANRSVLGVIANGDDEGVARVLSRIERPFVTFGFGDANIVSATRIKIDAGGSSFDVRIRNEVVGTISLPIPGRHMISNALACIASAEWLGINFIQIAAGLTRFTGAKRRWESHDAGGRIQIIDDYAHHPTEIAALAAAARSASGKDQRVVIAFQPQLFTRTKRFYRQFGAELAKFDSVFLLEIDGAGERDTGNVRSTLIADEIRNHGGSVATFHDVDDLILRAQDLLLDGDCLITAGAGNIREAAERLSQLYRSGQPASPPLSITPPTKPEYVPLPESLRQGVAARLKNKLFVRPQPACTVLELFREIVNTHPDAIAVSCGETQLSYRGLDTASNRLGRLLLEKGVARGDVAGVRLPSSVELIAVILALAKIGAVYLPLDCSLPAARLGFMLRKAKARIVLSAEGAASGPLHQEIANLGLDEIKLELSHQSPVDPTPVALADRPGAGGDPAYICFTSGSAGQPKGVAISHASLANLVLGVRDLFGIGRGTRMVLNTSISFDVSLGEIWMTLCGGGELLATGSNKPLVGDQLGDFIEHNAITHTAITPSVLATLRRRALPNLACIISAGEACPPALIGIWAPGRRFFNAYGPTEATIYATIARCTAGAKVTIGKPLRNVTARILDVDLRPVAIGKAGELCLGGAGAAIGYIGLEAETQERFINLPVRPGQTERLYRTGDLVSRQRDGSLTYLGRIDSQVKILGNRIELEEIEQAIAQHPSILDVAVCAGERGDAKELVCFAVLKSADDFDWATVRDRLSSWLPAYMIPATCVPVGAIAHTLSGKKDRLSLLSGYRSKKIQRTEYAGPRNDIEAKVAAIWKSVLEAETEIGVYEDFEWLGGDSLKGLLLVLEVEKAFGIRVPPGHFGGFTTIFRMSVQIADLLWNPGEPAEAAVPNFRSSRVYKQLRDLTAGWNGTRATTDAIIVSSGPAAPDFDFFVCIQMEEELHSLAAHLGDNFRVHAMRSGHLVMDYTPEATNALCEHYIKELEAIRPTGNLLIGGICQGGLIAATMANLLRERGIEIPLLVLMEQSRLIPYDGKVAFFYSEESFINPYRRYASAIARYDEIYGDRHSVDLVPGAHGRIHAPPQVHILVEKLRSRLDIPTSPAVRAAPRTSITARGSVALNPKCRVK